MKCFIAACLFLLLGNVVQAQIPKTVVNKTTGDIATVTQAPANAQNKVRADSIGFEHRVPDTITISYKFLDSIRSNQIDSSVNDFDKYFSVLMEIFVSRRFSHFSEILKIPILIHF